MTGVAPLHLVFSRAALSVLVSSIIYSPVSGQQHVRALDVQENGRHAGRFSALEKVQFEHLSVEQGLSHPGVYSIIQDTHGFIWIGTTDGLNRYDGYTFQTIQPSEDGSESLGGDIIYALTEDRSERIWIGTVGGGLCVLDRPSGSFKRFRHRPDDPASLSHDYVYAVYEDQRGRIWVGTRRGLDQVDLPSESFSHFIPDDPLSIEPSASQVTAIYEQPDQPGILWIGTWGDGLKKFDAAQSRFTHYRQEEKGPQGLGRSAIRFIYEMPQLPNILWIGTEGGGLEKFDVHQETFSHYAHAAGNPGAISSNFVRCMVRDRNGSVWVGTRGAGLNLFDPVRGDFFCYRNKPSDPLSLSNDDVMTLFEDRSGVLWIGTRAGLNRFVPLKARFLHFKHSPSNDHSLSSSFLYGLHEDDAGTLWVATWGGGLNRYDPATESFSAYRHDPHDSATLRNDFVRSVYIDRAGSIWVGNSQTVLHRFDPRTGRAKSATLLKNAPEDEESVVNVMLEDHEGIFWIGTGVGLFEFDRKKWQGTPVNIGWTLEAPKVLALHEDVHGMIWIGTRDIGLGRYDKRSRTVKWFRHDKNNPNSLANNTVFSIHEEQDGVLWIGTAGGGLNRFDADRESFTAYTMEQGLPANTVYGLLGDQQGHFWISTTRGLARFRPRTGECEIFDIRDGLQSYDYNMGSFCKGRGGILYFGGVNGLNVIRPDNIRRNLHIPPMVLTSFKVFNKEVHSRTGLWYVRQLEIEPGEDFISFEFAALDFVDPARNLYAYKMEGFDRDWINAGTRRYAAYTNLPAGEYVFRVKGSNNDGLWNNSGIHLSIVVHSPFWETWWFRSALALAALMVIYSLYRYRLSRAVALERLRLRIASDLHDEIGSNLGSIALQGQMATRLPHLSPGVQARLTEIVALAQETSQSVRDIVWLINPEHDAFHDLALKLKETAAKMLEGMAYDFRASDGSVVRNLETETKRMTLLMFKEALNNILRHAQAQHIIIEMCARDGMMMLKVQDDGVGFTQGHRSNGDGIANMRRRAASIGGTVCIESRPNNGTTVEIRIPMAQRGAMKALPAQIPRWITRREK